MNKDIKRIILVHNENMIPSIWITNSSNFIILNFDYCMYDLHMYF